MSTTHLQFLYIMSCNLCFQNQNQESSDAIQVPDGDGLSDTRIHKDGNDEDRDHAVSIMVFFYFFHIGHFFSFKIGWNVHVSMIFLQRSIVFFFTHPFPAIHTWWIFFCNSWLIVFAIYLYVYRRKEMTLKRRHSRTRVQTQVPPSMHPTPRVLYLGPHLK